MLNIQRARTHKRCNNRETPKNEFVASKMHGIGSCGGRLGLLHSELSQRLQMNRVRTVCDAQAPCQRPPGAKIKFLQRFVIQKRTHQDAKLWSSEPPPAPWSCMESSIML
jgi:hypothetical protein